jgi:hypothetical protein
MPDSESEAYLATKPIKIVDVTYITGGVGEEEREALHADEKNYNLHIMSASKSGEFVGDTHLVIRDHKGEVLVDALAGPLFFASLPAGVYTIEASSEGQFKKQSIRIDDHKVSYMHLSWQ